MASYIMVIWDIRRFLSADFVSLWRTLTLITTVITLGEEVRLSCCFLLSASSGLFSQDEYGTVP